MSARPRKPAPRASPRATPRVRSAVDLAEDDVLRADDRDDVREHVTARHVVEAGEVEEAGRADATPVRARAAVGDEEDAKLALGRLDARIRLAGGHGHALRVVLEVVDERLHRVLHLLARRRGDLAVVRFDQAGLHPVEALRDDAQRLAHLLAPDQVTVVTVTVVPNGYVKVKLVVDLVRLVPPQVPVDARATQHHAGEAVIERLLGRNCADVDEPLLPDAVVCEQLLDLVETRAELLREAEDVVAQPDRHVHRHAARPHVRGVHARARHALVELHQLLALLEAPKERRERANVKRVARDGEEVVEDPRDLEEHGADHLRAPRHLTLEEALDRHRVAVLGGHHRHVVEAVKVGQGLQIRLVLDELLRSAVQQPNVRVRARDHLAVHLEHEPEHAVRGRVLRPKVHREVLDLRLVLHVERDVGAQLGARYH
mmetsp:Transcript_17972/g.55975  ORF Transcript_17972/g.55975 Transcript_17972/m.55975 type:complete len:430 (-) Transcript_17972:116-1405(-)